MKRVNDTLRRWGISAPHPALALALNYGFQRPGFDPRDYGDRSAYRSDARRAENGLREIETAMAIGHAWLAVMTDADVLAVGERERFAVTQHGEQWRADYCTGQYRPTEYRYGVARWMSAVAGEVRARLEREAMRGAA